VCVLLCFSVLLCFIDPRVRKIKNFCDEASSCPGIFFRNLRFGRAASGGPPSNFWAVSAFLQYLIWIILVTMPRPTMTRRTVFSLSDVLALSAIYIYMVRPRLCHRETSSLHFTLFGFTSSCNYKKEILFLCR